jgi:hypothetical protein
MRLLANGKKLWDRLRTLAKVDCRRLDLRHTFITRLAENPHVSEETILALRDTSAGECSNGIHIFGRGPKKTQFEPWNSIKIPWMGH